MDFFQMTAPCGLDCFNCHFYLALENNEAKVSVEIMLFNGCRNHDAKYHYKNIFLVIRIVVLHMNVLKAKA